MVCTETICYNIYCNYLMFEQFDFANKSFKID